MNLHNSSEMFAALWFFLNNRFMVGILVILVGETDGSEK